MSKLQIPLELWGGVECTINRVGAVYHDQHAKSGHRDRVEQDLELLEDLGLRTLRTAMLWEHFEKAGNWACFDDTLAAMRRLGMRPIVGLLHHGSGPAHSSLLDPEFPEKLSAYAAAVARRYPWVTDYTPVNEPQTTGRFACLYGHWYPHHRDMRSYIRALHNQMKGIILSMQAIRRVQPAAQLVHTEDGGQTFAAPSLEKYRVEREHRRWLGTDLLCGLVTRGHPLFGFLLRHGLSEREILWFGENACPPAMLGLNYYVTSDRYLDDRRHIYPRYLSGGDTGYEPLVDIEAVRVRPEGIAGAGAVLRQAWERYRLPVGITEAHLGCTDAAEQKRWLAEVWRQAQQAHASGVDVRAVTVWGLLGLYDWCNLCTDGSGTYEAGAFDVSSGTPVPTPLAGLVAKLARGESADDIELSSPGWWRKDSRLTIPVPNEEEELVGLDAA